MKTQANYRHICGTCRHESSCKPKTTIIACVDYDEVFAWAPDTVASCPENETQTFTAVIGEGWQ